MHWHPPELSEGSVLAAEGLRGSALCGQIREVRLRYLPGLTKVDFIVNERTCVFFAALQTLRMVGIAKGLQRRLEEARPHYAVKVCVVLVDVETNDDLILELNRICFYLDYALFLAWSHEEAAAVVKALKTHENKKAEDYLVDYKRKAMPPVERARRILTSFKPLTAADATMLLLRFGSLHNIASATTVQLMDCPGIGAAKADALARGLNELFFAPD